MSLYNTNFIANINGVNQDLGNIFYNWTSNTINIPSNEVTAQRYSITYKKPTIILETDITASMDGYASTGDQVITFGPQVQGQFVLLGNGTNGAAFMDDGININYLGTTNIGSNTGTGVFWDGIKWFGNTSGSGSATANIISYDGIYWQSTGTTNTSSGGWTWKAYFNGSIYLLINGGRANAAAVSYSYDGINWTAVSSLPMSTWAVGWNGLVWLVGGTTNTTIYYSYDGITWVSTGQAPFSSGPRDFAWTGTRWMAVGNNNGSVNEIFYTTNPLGTSGWTASSNSGTDSTIGLCWNNKILTCITGAGIIMYSPDGISFTNATTSLGDNAFIKWNGRTFVTLCVNNVRYSYNGIQWITYPASMTQSICTEYNHRRLNTITFQRQLIIAGGNGVLTYSLSNGTSWISGSTANNSLLYNKPIYNGRLWFCPYNSNGGLTFSYNGIKWFSIGPGRANYQNTYAIGWNNVMWVICGWSNIGSNITYSYDGFTYITSDTGNLLSYPYCILWTGKMWIAGGGSANNNTIAYSSDGINWTAISGTATGGINNTVRTLATNGNIIIAGVDTLGLYYSYNGITWISIGTSIMGSVKSIDWNGSIWVAVGQTTNSTAYSYNGINWFGGTNIFSTSGLCVIWNGTMWCAGGSGTNTIAYSFNGINWTAVTPAVTFDGNGCTSIGTNYNVSPKPYIQHPTIAFGEGTNTIAYSPDGIVWKPLGNTVFTTSGRKGFWNGKLWVGVGIGGNTIAYSLNGYNWIGLGSTVFSTAGYSVTSNGSIWVAVGSGGNTIAYSTNGIQWSGVTGSSSIFSTSGQNVVWTGKNFYATGIGTTNNAAISNNGITWSVASSGADYPEYGIGGIVRVSADLLESPINYLFSNPRLLFTRTFTNPSWSLINNDIIIGGAPTILNGAGNTTGLPTAAHEWAAEQQAMSQSGQYIVVAAIDTYTETNAGKAFYSTNYGRTFTQSTGLPTSNVQIRAPAMSDDGQFVVVFNALASPTVWRSTNYGASFSQVSNTGATYYLNNSAISNDGNTIYMTALGGAGMSNASLYRTTNANLGMSATWTAINPSGSLQVLNRIECTSNGSVVLVGGRLGLYRSTDTGSTWTNLADGTRGLPASSGTNYWYAVTMTRDGTKMLVGAQNNSVYISTNSGTSFTVVSALSASGWITAAISTDGTHMALGVDNNNNTGLVYWSTNSGSTWSNFTPSSSRQVNACRIQRGILLFTTGGYANGTSDNNVYIGRSIRCSCLATNGQVIVAGCCSMIPDMPVTYPIAFRDDRVFGYNWTSFSNSSIPNGLNDICWNGKRFVGTGVNYLGYSNDGFTWYSSQQSSIFSTAGYGIASNPGVGAFVAPSAMVIDDNGISGNGIANSRTLEFVSSDPYFQTGFNNMTVKVETKTIF